MALNIGSQSLLSATSRVEVPYIKVTLAGISFGVYIKERQATQQYASTPNLSQRYVNVTYPNMVQSLVVDKNASGVVNSYKLTMTYAVRPGDDPNFIEKVISKAKATRKITFSYGDANAPNFIFREEEGLLTSVKETVNINSSTIQYTINAVSNSAVQGATKKDFEKRTAQPSRIIKELLFKQEYDLTSLFPGMQSLRQVEEEGFIASDDAVVEIEAKQNISVLDYLTYLVSCMRWVNDPADSNRKTCVYHIATFDDILNEYGGAYFKVVRYTSTSEALLEDQLDWVDVDIGYTNSANVVGFTINDDESFAILYDYNDTLNYNEYRYDIDAEGNLNVNKMSRVALNRELDKTTESDKTWWANMTAYPINATLTIRGLLRNVLLMSKIRVNVLFYGQKHIYSGIYIVTGQKDTVNSSGFRTTLSLTRVGGVSYD